jgi:hypothetical protein
MRSLVGHSNLKSLAAPGNKDKLTDTAVSTRHTARYNETQVFRGRLKKIHGEQSSRDIMVYDRHLNRRLSQDFISIETTVDSSAFVVYDTM